jgi:hypothetical protein
VGFEEREEHHSFGYFQPALFIWLISNSNIALVIISVVDKDRLFSH